MTSFLNKNITSRYVYRNVSSFLYHSLFIFSDCSFLSSASTRSNVSVGVSSLSRVGVPIELAVVIVLVSFVISLWQWTQCKQMGQDPIFLANAALNFKMEPSRIFIVVTRWSSFNKIKVLPSIPCSRKFWKEKILNKINCC